MSVAPHRYQQYMQTRARLATAIDDLAACYRDIGVGARADALSGVRHRLDSDAFRLMVVGEFKRGKSTLVNAMLGEQVLPAKVAPCTAVITEVKYAEKKEAVLHYTDSSRPPAHVPVDQLRRYITIQEDDYDEDEIRQPSPYSRMELRFPLELCKNNVEIIDSPGLNEHSARTEVALEYLPNADALVMVLSCEQQLSQSERDFIDRHMGAGRLSHVFFVWNRFDAIQDSPDDVKDVKRLSERYLSPRLATKGRVWFVSARDALAGRLRNDSERITASGMEEFESALEEFLTKERGRLKILSPLRSAEQAARHCAIEVLPQREALLGQSIEDIEARHREIVPRLEEMRRQQVRLLRDIERRGQSLREALRTRLGAFALHVEQGVGEASENIVVGWTDATISRKRTKEKILAWLQDWLEEEVGKFETEQLKPLLKQEADDLEADLESRLGDFLDELGHARALLTEGLEIETEEEKNDVSAVNRVLSAVGGFLLLGPAGAIEGASGGFVSLIKGIPIYITAAIVLAIVGASTPVGMAVLAGIGLIRTWMTGKDAAGRLRENVCQEFTKAFRSKIPEMERKIADRVAQQYEEVGKVVEAGMSTLIGEVEEEVEEVLRQKRAGEDLQREGRAQVAAVRARIRDITQELEEVRGTIEA
jgi:hypothetical protein